MSERTVRWPFIPAARSIDIVRAEGAYLYTTAGHRILDAAGGAIVVNVGHGRESVVRAVATDPLNPNHVLAGLQSYTMSTPGPEEPSIWESTNCGTTFSPAYSGAATMTTFTPTISDIAFGTGGRVFALIGNKIHVNDANGALGGWKETSAVLNSTNSGTLRPCHSAGRV